MLEKFKELQKSAIETGRAAVYPSILTKDLSGIVAKYDEGEQLNEQCYEMHKQIAAMQERITQLLAEVDELRAADTVRVQGMFGVASEDR